METCNVRRLSLHVLRINCTLRNGNERTGANKVLCYYGINCTLRNGNGLFINSIEDGRGINCTLRNGNFKLCFSC